MKKSLLQLVAAATLSVAASGAWAVDTVTPSPLSAGLPTTDEVKYDPNQPIAMPVITWGADMATLFGNGNSVITSGGSIFDRQDVQLRLYREDNFRDQVQAFRRGETPFLRGTADMVTAAAEALCDDARTCPQIFYNLSRSVGGDVLMGNTDNGVTDVASLRGKTIGLQAYGPHMNLLVETLAIGGLTVSDVTVKWYRDLGADSVDGLSAWHAFQAGEVDAAFLIAPDGAAFAPEGTDPMSASKQVFSTISLDNVIFDVIAVRPDFASAHPEVVAGLTAGLLQANEAFAAVFADPKNGVPDLLGVEHKGGVTSQYLATAAAGAKLLFDTDGDVFYEHTTMVMYNHDLKMSGWTGNVKFLTDPGSTKGVVWYGSIAKSASAAFSQLGFMNSATAPALSAYQHDWKFLKAGLTEQFGVEAPTINQAAAARAVEQLGSAGVSDASIISFEIRFAANQQEFSADLYAADFDRVLEIMSRAGGAVVAVEGHSGTFKYLVAKHGKKPVPASTWREIAQSNRNLSLSRAQSVVSELQAYAVAQGYDLNFANVVPVGNGISNPAGGMCTWQLQGGERVQDPCGPNGWSSVSAGAKPKGNDWKTNDAHERRVVFSVVNVEGEAEVFADDSF